MIGSSSPLLLGGGGWGQTHGRGSKSGIFLNNSICAIRLPLLQFQLTRLQSLCLDRLSPPLMGLLKRADDLKQQEEFTHSGLISSSLFLDRALVPSLFSACPTLDPRVVPLV